MKNAHTYRAQLPDIADISDMLAQIPAREPEPSADESAAKAAKPADTGDAPAKDPLYAAAVAFVRESGRASPIALQRKFEIGYNRAALLIEDMEQQGVVTAAGFNGHREVVRE